MDSNRFVQNYRYRSQRIYIYSHTVDPYRFVLMNTDLHRLVKIKKIRTQSHRFIKIRTDTDSPSQTNQYRLKQLCRHLLRFVQIHSHSYISTQIRIYSQRFIQQFYFDHNHHMLQSSSNTFWRDVAYTTKLTNCPLFCTVCLQSQQGNTLQQRGRGTRVPSAPLSAKQTLFFIFP